jgi:hypothetical protein
MPSKYAVSRKVKSISVGRHTRKNQPNRQWNRFLNILKVTLDIDPKTQVEHTFENMMLVRGYIGFLPMLRMFPSYIFAPCPEDLFDFYTKQQVYSLLQICYDVCDHLFKDKYVIVDQEAKCAGEILCGVASGGQYEFERYVLGRNVDKSQHGGGKESEFEDFFEKQFNMKRGQHGGTTPKASGAAASVESAASSSKSAVPVNTKAIVEHQQANVPAVASAFVGAAGIRQQEEFVKRLEQPLLLLSEDKQEELRKKARETEAKAAETTALALISQQEGRLVVAQQISAQMNEYERILVDIFRDPKLAIGEKIIELIRQMDNKADKIKLAKILKSTMTELNNRFVMNKGIVEVMINGEKKSISIGELVRTASDLQIRGPSGEPANVVVAYLLGPMLGDKANTFKTLERFQSPLFCAIAAAAATRATFLRVEPLFRPRTYLKNPGSTFTGPIQLLDGTIELGPGKLFVLKDSKAVVQYKRDSVEPFASEQQLLNQAAPGGPDQDMVADGWVGQRAAIVQRGDPVKVLREREFRLARQAVLQQRKDHFQCEALGRIQHEREPIVAKKATAEADLSQVNKDIKELDPELEQLGKQIRAFADKDLIKAALDLEKKQSDLALSQQPCVKGAKVGFFGSVAACPTDQEVAAAQAAAQKAADAAQAKLDGIKEKLNIKGLDEAKLEEREKELKRDQKALNKDKNRLDGEIAAENAKLVALENRAKKIPEGAGGQCAKVEEDEKKLANQVPVWDVKNPAPGGKFGRPFLKLGDLEPINACPAGFKHDAAQFACLPADNNDSKYPNDRFICQMINEDGKNTKQCIPLYKFDQQRDPFKFLGFVILAGGLYEVDCGGGRIYAGIAGSGIAAAGITYGVASWGLGYIPDILPGASLVKRHVPTVLGVSAGLLVSWTQLNDSECLVPISYAITTAGMGLAEVAIIGSLTALALFSTYMAASGVVNVWKRRTGGRAVKKLIESTEGKTWDNIKLQYLTKLIAIANEFAETASGDGYEQLYRSFAKKIRVSTKQKILKAHAKYSKAHKIWEEKTGVEGLVRSSVTGEPTLSSFVEHLKDEIIN